MDGRITDCGKEDVEKMHEEGGVKADKDSQDRELTSG
jgi:hypothetical protein